MALKSLIPAPQEALCPGWDLVLAEAGRSGGGLKTTLYVVNGGPKDMVTLSPGNREERNAVARQIGALAAVAPEKVGEIMIRLVHAAEGMLRHEEADEEPEEKKRSQATKLVQLALAAGAELFHVPDGEPYATIATEGHKETWPLKVKGFRRWLARQFYQAGGTPPGAQAVQDALGVLEGKALFDGPEIPVHIRMAAHHDALYLDLADAQWQAVEVTARGWRIVAEPPVKFRRPRGMLPVPPPVTGGSLQALRPFVNVGSEEDWRLLISWVVAALRAAGPFPILVLHGEQGSGKSTLVRVLRTLVDPNTAAVRTAPREERDLVIAANNGWLIALDNLSHLPEWLSDALCRLATGSGFATRELYSDAEEVIFAAQRPIVLNGIEELATRPDLLDRAIVLYLPRLLDDTRREEEDFWQAFTAAHPRILGALLDIACHSLRTRPSVQVPRKPRMADFAVWACAAAPACGWTAQDFLDAYAGVREASHALTLEASPVGQVVRDFVTRHGPWEGTASELLAALDAEAGEKTVKQQQWPKNGRTLSNALRRLAATLRAVGITVEFGARSGKKGSRVLRLSAESRPAGSARQGREHGEV